MNFRPELAAKVMTGEKTVTRRMLSENSRSPWWRHRCGLVVGREYAVCPGRGKVAIGRIRVTDVRMEMLGVITEDEARREGFDSISGFMDAFRAINGGRENGWTYVWRIEFELAERHLSQARTAAP